MGLGMPKSDQLCPPGPVMTTSCVAMPTPWWSHNPYPSHPAQSPLGLSVGRCRSALSCRADSLRPLHPHLRRTKLCVGLDLRDVHCASHRKQASQPGAIVGNSGGHQPVAFAGHVNFRSRRKHRIQMRGQHDHFLVLYATQLPDHVADFIRVDRQALRRKEFLLLHGHAFPLQTRAREFPLIESAARWSNPDCGPTNPALRVPADRPRGRLRRANPRRRRYNRRTNRHSKKNSANRHSFHCHKGQFHSFIPSSSAPVHLAGQSSTEARTTQSIRRRSRYPTQLSSPLRSFSVSLLLNALFLFVLRSYCRLPCRLQTSSARANPRISSSVNTRDPTLCRVENPSSPIAPSPQSRAAPANTLRSTSRSSVQFPPPAPVPPSARARRYTPHPLISGHDSATPSQLPPHALR